MMWTRYSRLAGLTLLFGTLLAPGAHADTRFDIRIGVPGPPVVAYAPPAYRGYVWQPGYYVRAGYARQWVPGRWVRPDYEYGRRGWAGGPRRDDRRGWDRDRRWDRDERRDRDWRR
jgi:hypothetical protein